MAAISAAPLVASHSNAYAHCASPRNLTDRQLHQIRDTGGIVGLNFATFFLNENGTTETNMDWDVMLRHIDHLITHLGEDNVGLGSDFDGATIPQGIGDVTGLPALQQAMLDHQYGEALVRKLCCDNWLALLGRTWGG